MKSNALKVLCAVAVMAIVGATVCRAETAPERDIVSPSWELNFTFHFPRVISVRLPGEDKAQLYWYVTYTVANLTDEDQMFIPDILMYTDAGDLLQANKRISPAIFNAIKKVLDNPLLESPAQIVGKILQGKDNARDGVAIWPVPDHNVNMMRIFFGGLSGETHEVTDPATGEKTLLRKTLMVEFQTPGDVAHAASKQYIKKKQDWVVR